MKKIVFGVLAILCVLLLAIVCMKQPKNESIESPDSEYGFPGEILDDSDTYIDTDNEMIEEYEEIEGYDIITSIESINKENNDTSENNDISENDSEESIDGGVIKDNTYDGDLLEPPPVSSAGVL